MWSPRRQQKQATLPPETNERCRRGRKIADLRVTGGNTTLMTKRGWSPELPRPSREQRRTRCKMCTLVNNSLRSPGQSLFFFFANKQCSRSSSKRLVQTTCGCDRQAQLCRLRSSSAAESLWCGHVCLLWREGNSGSALKRKGQLHATRPDGRCHCEMWIDKRRIQWTERSSSTREQQL